MPSPPELELAFEAHVLVDPRIDVGQTPHGLRRIIPITGGTFEGPRLRGRVLPGGADWQVHRSDGVAEIYARYMLEADDGGLIYVVNQGIRHAPAEVLARLNAGEAVDPALVYFRTSPTFETASGPHDWLMRSMFVGTGERYPNGVVIRYWRVL
jgi:hypothetical protein